MNRVIAFGMMAAVVAMMFGATAGTVTVTSVTAQQRYPWNGKVDIVVAIDGLAEDLNAIECLFVATNGATKMEIPVKHITRNGSDARCGTNWIRKYVWDSVADVGEVKISDLELFGKIVPVGVQLWDGGPYWAECNLGAVNPEDAGYYFCWGDVIGYTYDDADAVWVSSSGERTSVYPFDSSVCQSYGKSDDWLEGAGFIDSNGNLTHSHDAASMQLGVPWRIPTMKELNSLAARCTIKWGVQNGVYGLVVTGNGECAPNSIFLPAVGNYGVYKTESGYWFSTSMSDSSGAYNLLFGSSGTIGSISKVNTNYWRSRFEGRPIRAVHDNFQCSGEAITRMSLDNRNVVREATAMEEIRFSPSWGKENYAAAMVVVSVNGEVVTNSNEAGIFEWMPTQDGTYQFLHAVFTNGVQVGTVLSAIFIVDGVNPENPVINPESGMIFDTTLSVSMFCPSSGAKIYYTLDGSDPTTNSIVYEKFKICSKTIVKARAFYSSGSGSEVVAAEYALGRCADPVIFPMDGTVFKHSRQMVRIDQNGEEGVLRYTTDGTEPTQESPVYEGPFTADDSTVVKAKVFSDRYFDSTVVTVNLTREWETVATPVITAEKEFKGSETKVMISCAMPEATIRYTTNGSEPNSHSPKYTGPFWVSESCTVKAVAMCADYLTSEVASRTITKVWGIGDTMGAPDHAFTTSGDADFFRVDDETAPNKEAMRSGAIGDSAGYGLYSRSVLSSTVQGPCTIKFKWRSSCEQDDDYEWDHAEFAVDGVVVARINDVTEWREVSHDITDGGSHVITWSYLKDDSEKEGEDCLWVADYSWTPAELYTHESSVPVPYDWILSYLPHTPYEYDRFEAAVRETAANGMNTVEEAYIAGLDPSKESSKFMAIITMDENVPTITWSPDLSDDDLPRHYTIYGKRALDGIEDWEIVTDANKPNMRFFKVTVNMP